MAEIYVSDRSETCVGDRQMHACVVVGLQQMRAVAVAATHDGMTTATLDEIHH